LWEKNWDRFWVYSESFFPGPSYQLTVAYKLPFGNNQARGAYVAKREEYELQKTTTEKFAFEMKKNIESLSNALVNSLDILDGQEDITDLRQQAYANEIAKYDSHNSNSTQIDVLNAHEDYMQSLLSTYAKEYIVMFNWLNLQFLCNDIPGNTEQLNVFFK
jgi:outer membrane protein TolC